MRSRACQLIFGEEDHGRRDWCEYWTVEKYLKARIPFDKALSICCGFGHVERSLSRLHVANQIIGTDIAPEAIAKAAARAKEEGIENVHYYLSDLNREDLGIHAYDLIWANGALHHIKDLNFAISNIHRALKPDGYLIANEYVGPDYQQIGKRQEELVRAVLPLLPDQMKRHSRYRIDRSDRSFKNSVKNCVKELLNKIDTWTGTDRAIWYKPPIEYFLGTDPSECVHSSGIIPTLKQTFADVTVRYFNGSLLMYALGAEFYANYAPDNANHKKLLDLLFKIEDTLIDMGELTPDNAHIICHKR
jgi:SAM-dependent methyltransferase